VPEAAVVECAVECAVGVVEHAVDSELEAAVVDSRAVVASRAEVDSRAVEVQEEEGFIINSEAVVVVAVTRAIKMSEIELLVKEFLETGSFSVRNKILNRLEFGTPEYYSVLEKIRDKPTVKQRRNVLREALVLSRESAERQTEMNVEFKDSTLKLQSVTSVYQTTREQLGQGTRILRQLVDVDAKDRQWLYLGLSVFISTIVYIIYKRFWFIV
jgi:hypothetical protein